MAEITECTAADRDEFWQDTPQDVTGATETGEQRQYVVESTPIHCAGCEALARVQEGVNRMRAAIQAGALKFAEGGAVTQATYTIPPTEATERELRAYLAADKTEQEDE